MLPVNRNRQPKANGLEVLPLKTAAVARKLLHYFERCPLPVARGGTGQERANRLNGLAIAADDPANVALPQLQFENDQLSVRNFGKHHLVRKFDQLTNNELEKLFHRSKLAAGKRIVE